MLAGRMIHNQTAIGKDDTQYLNGARGLAALIVVAGHCSNRGFHLVPGLDLNGTAKSGVWLFFVLSAYLLTAKLVRDVGHFGGMRAIFHYGVRRVFRILPLYYVVLSALVIVGLLTPSSYGWHLLLLEGTDHLWTIPVEMAFYAVLPLLALSLASIPVSARLLAAVAIYCLSVLIYYLAGASGAETNSLALWDFGPFFAAGVVLSLTGGVKVKEGVAIAITAAGLAVVIISSPRVMPLAFPVTAEGALQWSWLCSFSWAGVLFGVSRSGLLKRALSNGFLLKVGAASFGIYLSHYHLLAWASDAFASFPGTLVGWGLVAISFLIGWHCYHQLEAPILSKATDVAERIAPRRSSTA